eukprot:15470485-Alexandrium_andersonii.AAC.1
MVATLNVASSSAAAFLGGGLAAGSTGWGTSSASGGVVSKLTSHLPRAVMGGASRAVLPTPASHLTGAKAPRLP